MSRREINLIGGFYKDSSLPWSAQDTVNWLPVPASEGGTRSPMKLRGAPGLRSTVQAVIEALRIVGNAPDTSVGASYSYSYSITGGVPPYSLEVGPGSLPAGLSLSGLEISGIPTTEQISSFTVSAADSGGMSASLDDSIRVFAEVSEYPVVADITVSSNSSLQTTHVANYPATVNSGDLLVYIAAASKWVFASGGPNVNFDTPSGLTKLQSNKPAGNSRNDTAVFYRVANGSESGGTVTFSTGDTAHFSCGIYRIANGTYSGLPTLSSDGRTTELSPSIASHDSGLSIPALFIVAVAGEGGAAISLDSYPFSGNNAQAFSGGNNSSAFFAACSLEKPGGGSISAGSNRFELSSSANSFAYTLSIGASA
jgi:hypothetical protein